MARRKKKNRRKPRSKASSDVLRRQGAEAFRRGDYDLAVAAWRRVSRAARDPKFTLAFAEACFRRGLNKGHLDSLRQAANLGQHKTCYFYHLALAHHRAGHLEKAKPLYRRALNQHALAALEGDDLAARVAYALGLLLLQTDHRPSRDPFWKHLEQSSDDSPLGMARLRLAWAERMIYKRATPPASASGPLWEALAARSNGQADPSSIDLDNLPGTAVGIAHYHLGARAWEQNDAERAFAHWHAAHKAALALPALENNLFAAARTLATQRLKAEDVEGALEVANVGLTIKPDDNGLKTIAAQAHFSLGHAAATTSRWEGAYHHWQAVLRVGGQRGRRLVINLALAQEQQKNWDQAAELWREALRRRPRKADHPDALNDVQVARLWHHVAENYQRAGNMYDAKTTYLNALKWAPGDVKLRTAYVDMLLDDGRLVSADNQLDILLETHPDDVELLDRRAQIYAAQYYTHDALGIWKRILDVQPDHPGAIRQIARQYEKLGDNSYRWGWASSALKSYQAGLEYAPNDGMLLASIAMCHMDLGDEELARQFFDRAYAAEPTNQDMYLTAIKFWIGHDDLDTVQTVIQHASEKIELSSIFFIDIADYCYRYDHFDLAQDYMAEARALAAGDSKLLLALADLAGRNDDAVLALEIVENVLKVDPHNGFAHLLKGLALVHSGGIKAARRSWNKAEKIAHETGNEGLLMAVEEMRLFYDPDERLSPIGFLERMLGSGFFDDDPMFDQDNEWD